MLEVAKAKLREVTGTAESATRAVAARERGRMTMADCTVVFRKRLNEGFGLRGHGKTLRRIRPNSILYREKTIKALFKTWPELEKRDVRKVTECEVEHWAERFSADYSATVYNNTLDTLRALFRIAEDAGARHGNPAAKVGRVAVKQKILVLPERDQFLSFVEANRSRALRADLFQKCEVVLVTDPKGLGDQFAAVFLRQQTGKEWTAFVSPETFAYQRQRS